MFQMSQELMLANGTYKVSEVKVSPARLIEVFGEPMESDGYKSSGEYLFVGDDNEVFTVYDWKSTSLYESYLESPQQFWSYCSPKQFSIGGKSNPDSFVTWLLRKLG